MSHKFVSGSVFNGSAIVVESWGGMSSDRVIRDKSYGIISLNLKLVQLHTSYKPCNINTNYEAARHNG